MGYVLLTCLGCGRENALLQGCRAALRMNACKQPPGLMKKRLMHLKGTMHIRTILDVRCHPTITRFEQGRVPTLHTLPLRPQHKVLLVMKSTAGTSAGSGGSSGS